MKYYLLADLSESEFPPAEVHTQSSWERRWQILMNLKLISNSKLQGCKLFVYGIDQNMDNGDLQVKLEQ